MDSADGFDALIRAALHEIIREDWEEIVSDPEITPVSRRFRGRIKGILAGRSGAGRKRRVARKVILGFLAGLPKDRQELLRVSEFDRADSVERYSYFYNNKVALVPFTLSGPDRLRDAESQFGTKDWRMIGFPAEGRNGTYLTTDTCLVMTSFCAAPTEAWEWLRAVMLGEDDEWGFVRWSSLKSAFDRRAEDLWNTQSLVYFNGQTESYSNYEPFTEADLKSPGYICRLEKSDTDRLKTLLDDVLGYPMIDAVPGEITEIVNEEISAFLGGVGTAEDCAAKIQSRVSIWLAEHK